MESGTKIFRSRFNINTRKILDCSYYNLYPVFAQFVIPGDVWKINVNALLRYQPMLSPSLTPCQARVRFFFVPLRLLDEKTDFIITGSEDGYFNKSKTVPSFNEWDQDPDDNPIVEKGSLAETLLGLPVGTSLEDLAVETSAPADYWRKAYYRIWWDFYRDENLSTASSEGSFDDWLTNNRSTFVAGGGALLSVCLPHDYFTKSLPWQLKGIAPAMSFDISGFGFSSVAGEQKPTVELANPLVSFRTSNPGTTNIGAGLGTPEALSDDQYQNLKKSLNLFASRLTGNVNGAFTMNDLRDLSAQTRVFERLARCGSRYTEYLRANFGISPADETLQRAQYLGGVKIPIVVTEVPQVAGAVNSSSQQTPVGTLRGKGISAGAGSIRSCHFKEFGVLLGLFDVRPALQYCQGLNRQFTYKSRFDFFNPSFQHLSEQEVRKSEIFCDPSDNKDDETFGFQAYANELRTGSTSIVGNMRGSLNFWHQGLIFASRPSLNDAFITGVNYATSWNRPFEVIENTQPIIADLAFPCVAHRPMVRYGTPGLVDHL